MLKIGRFNQLYISEALPFGYACTCDDEEVLLPNAVAPQGISLGDKLDLFVYPDADGRLMATPETPKAQVGDCVTLLVKDVNKAGAWLDWGLRKQLLLPLREQSSSLSVGFSVVVYLLVGEDGLIYASNKLHKFLAEACDGTFTAKQSVDMLIYSRTPMGFKAVINGTHIGLLHKDDAFKRVKIGETYAGFIKQIRNDDKIDLCFQFHDENARDSLQAAILEDLRSHGGFSTLTDKSAAEDINYHFNVSKKAYKNALGALYKQKLIVIEKEKIRLVDTD